MVRKKNIRAFYSINPDLAGTRIVDEHEWKYDSYTPLVPDEKLIIYELHIGDFQNQFSDITAKMDYFLELGVTAGKPNHP